MIGISFLGGRAVDKGWLGKYLDRKKLIAGGDLRNAASFIDRPAPALSATIGKERRVAMKIISNNCL